MPIFDKIQTHIHTLAEKHRRGYDANDKQYKLGLSDAFFCAADVVRNKKFRDAIHQVVEKLKVWKEKLLCIDAGTGTGVLGLYALVAGVDHCVFIEHNPLTMNICRDVLAYFGYAARATFLVGDATKVSLHKQWDLLLSETISSDTVEDFHRIVNHFLPTKKPDGIIVPSGVRVVAQDGQQVYKKYMPSLSWFFPRTIPTTLSTQQKRLDGSHLSHSLVVSFDVELYHNIWIRSGEAMSMGNPRTIQTAVLFD